MMRKLYLAIFLIAILILPSKVIAQRILSLSECKELALKNNVKIRNAKLQIDIARADKQEAIARFMPNVKAGATYFFSPDYLVQQHFDMPDKGKQMIMGLAKQLRINPAMLAALPTDYTLKAVKHGTMISLVATQPIFAGGRIINANKLADIQMQVKKIMLEQTEDDVAKTTEIYYNQILALYEKQKTLVAASKQLNRILHDVNNAVEAGIANKKDVLSVQIKQNEIELNKIKLENGINVSKMLLAQYVGLNTDNFDIKRNIIQDIPLPETYLTNHSEALEKRKEKILLNKKVEADRLLTKIKLGEKLPTLAIGAAALYHDLTNRSKCNVIGMITLNVPISDWWSNKGEKKQIIAEKIAQQDRDDAKQRMIIQMQNAYNNLVAAYKQIMVAKKTIEQTTENLRLNADYYKEGTTTLMNLLEAQTNDWKAHDQYAEAVINYMNCRTDYMQLTARGYL